MIKILFLITWAVAASSGAVKVQLKGVQEKRGKTLLCALFRNARGFPLEHERALEIQHAVKSESGWSCEFYNLKPAQYAVSVLHDKNGDGKMQQNKLGMPLEGWATSKNVVPGLRAPNFSESSFKLDGGEQTLLLNMHY